MTDVIRAVRFAAHKHRDQRRKNVDASPYINHPIEVAAVLATEGGVTDETLLIAAILHDTVEDTETSHEEIRQQFGSNVADLVRAVTDDKQLPKQERKRLQIERARHGSDAAKQLKVADKICNIRDITNDPPADWAPSRKREYFDWAEQVVAGCRGVNPALERAFDKALALARTAMER